MIPRVRERAPDFSHHDARLSINYPTPVSPDLSDWLLTITSSKRLLGLSSDILRLVK